MIQFLTTSRLRMAYRTQGDPDGLPLLLLHGSYGSSRWWEPLMELLPSEFHAIAPDLRGCGQSEATPAGYTIPEQAEDVLALIEALGWQDIDLVAHSTAGAVAIEIALQHPALLRSLSLVDSVPVEGVFTPIEATMLLEQMKTDRELLAQALQLLMPTYDLSIPEQADFFAQLVEDAANMALPAFTEIAISLSQWNRFTDAKRLTLPTLLLWGDQDSIVNRDAMTRTLIAIPGANNLEILHGVGHTPQIEAPLVLAEKIIEFITEDFTNFNALRQQAYTK